MDKDAFSVLNILLFVDCNVFKVDISVRC